jgi:hypothetical protein
MWLHCDFGTGVGVGADANGIGVGVGSGVGLITDAEADDVADADVDAEVVVVFDCSETGPAVCVVVQPALVQTMRTKTMIAASFFIITR